MRALPLLPGLGVVAAASTAGTAGTAGSILTLHAVRKRRLLRGVFEGAGILFDGVQAHQFALLVVVHGKAVVELHARQEAEVVVADLRLVAGQYQDRLG